MKGSDCAGTTCSDSVSYLRESFLSSSSEGVFATLRGRLLPTNAFFACAFLEPLTRLVWGSVEMFAVGRDPSLCCSLAQLPESRGRLAPAVLSYSLLSAPEEPLSSYLFVALPSSGAAPSRPVLFATLAASFCWAFSERRAAAASLRF